MVTVKVPTRKTDGCIACRETGSVQEMDIKEIYLGVPDSNKVVVTLCDKCRSQLKEVL